MYSLNDFLESGIVPQARLLTAPIDFAAIPIKTVSVQEFPLDDFIQKDELVLSTALGCDLIPERFQLLVEGAVRAQAAAIAFAFKDAGIAIPQEVLDYADAVKMPLLQLPWEHRFSSIQSAVLAAVQEEKLSSFKTIQNTLFNLFFESKSLGDAASCITCTFDCPVRITNTAGEVIGASGPDCGTDVPESAQTRVGIFLSGVLFGYLYLDVPPDASPEKLSLFEKYLAFPLSLWFNKKSIEDMTAIRLKNDFVRNLATRNYSSFQEMVQQGIRLHFDLTKPYTCIVMKVAAQSGNSVLPEYSNEIAQSAAEVEGILLREGKRRQLSTMVTNLSLEFTIFLENPQYDAEQEVQQYVDSAQAQIRQVFPAFQCLWGISESRLGPPDFGLLYANASLALQYCLNTKGTRHRLTYKDTKKALIVSVLSSHAEIQKNAREVLQPLLEYDANSNIGLLQTLTEFIRTSYNTSQTARNLHIHRQSFLYRLEKIQALTGMSLSEHDDLFVLETFSRIYASF
ncbi:PucR family transcriptional regulator ligand-binding domain-containing protein [Dysosmobacter sp.]